MGGKAAHHAQNKGWSLGKQELKKAAHVGDLKEKECAAENE